MPITLSAYVRKRNGVALGAPGSLTNMLSRSLGAGSFAMFWRHWNPIWGYYLARWVMKPLGRILPTWLAVIVTFAVSGALHDLAVTLVRWELTFFITPWFVLMGVALVASESCAFDYNQCGWGSRAMINTAFIVICLGLTYIAGEAFSLITN